VALAIAQALDGDTVQIPAGPATWSSPVTLNKAITLMGAGTNSTTIVNGTGNDMLIVSLPSDKPVRVTGIYFNCTGWGTCYAIRFLGGKMTSIRIDHCKFNLGKHVIWFRGWHYGVIDHCTFINPSIAVMVQDIEAGDVKDGDTAWSRPIVPGTVNTVCVEDCYLSLDNNAPGANDEELYGQTGGRATWRHNTLVSTYSGDTVCVDAHGNYGPTGNMRGTVQYEVYSNVFRVAKTYRFCYLRGGQHLVYNNTFINDAGGGASAITLIDELGFHTSDDIKNCYFWNNTLNGSPVNPVVGDTLVVPNQDYFNHAPQAGQVFYPYTPLVYPHPLVTPPTNPVTQVSPTSLNYPMEPNTGSSNQIITIRNVGASTLSGSISLSSTSSPSPWSLVGTTTYSVTTNTSATITLRYTPTTSADSFATVRFTDNGGGATISAVGGRPKTYIWPLGDSLTQGHDIPGGYRLPLYQLLTNAGVSVAFVGNTNDVPAPGLLPYPNHDGYGGFEIGGLAAGVRTWRSGIPAPHFVLLMIGLNDFRHNNDVQNATNRLENLIVEIATNAPSAKIIVADLNPWTNLQPTNDVMDTYYNPYIPSVVARQSALGRKVYLCDMRGKLSASDLEADNTHCTQIGFNKMATNWFGIISSQLLGAGKPTPPGQLRIVASGL
jgi:hypothetical protein